MLEDVDLAGQVYIFPVSYAQRSLWFLDQLAPGSSFYNLPVATRLFRPLNVAALRRSINEMVRRHESLRTAFSMRDGEPVQVVAPTLTIDVPVTDLRHLPEWEREQEALRITGEEAIRPFDLSTWPLLRARVVCIDEEDHILILIMHHIVSDFWSRTVFQEELSTLYDAFCDGRCSPLAELPLQYADFAAWERHWLAGSAGETHLAYWRKQLAELPTLKLPMDWPRPAIASFKGAAYDFWIEESLHASLVRLSQEAKVTLFMTLLAALQTLLYRYTGQDDIVTGTPVANRDHSDVQGILGLFTNSLVLRTKLSGHPSFREVLRRVRDVAIDAYTHQQYPFEKLVSELKPERMFAQNPFFQVHFQLLGGLGADTTPHSLVGDPVELDVATTKFDLALDIWEETHGLWAYLEYSSDLFSEATIAQMSRHFQAVLAGVVADPDRPVDDLALLSDEERQLILADWNTTETDYPRNACLHELFEAQVERTPDAIAVAFRDQRLTYGELNCQANRLAHHLRTFDVGADTLVAICAERSIEMIVGLLGTLKAGGAYVPLDPKDPSERLRRIMEDAQPRLVLTQQAVSHNLPLTSAPYFYLDTDWNTIADESTANPNLEIGAHNLAYAVYTSGSTGTPKAVLIESQSACNHLLWMQSALPLRETDRILQKYPYNFDASVCEIFGPLLAGAALIITEPTEHWDASEFIRVLQDERITVLDLVPSMLEALMREVDFAGCRALRRVVCGGEPLSPELRDRFFLQMSAELHNIYGPTEATIGATWARLLPEHAGQPVTIGRPIANTQIYILDSRLNPVPIGVSGELCIAGDCLARGYLNQPGLTAEKFVPNPFSDDADARLYRTGDLGRYLRDGSIEYLGRMDEQVKVRGHRVEPGEIEHALSRYPGMRGCAVVPTKDRHGRQSLVAYVVPPQDPPELWPSLGEYDVYDAVLYRAMTHDERRTRAYRVAIDSAVKGRAVLDIGTGADAVLARLCVDGGATHVYAVEVEEDAFQRASQLIDSLGLSSRVTVIHADSTDLQLPEPVDVCVSEILGTIGSSEGAILTLNDARRFLKEDGIMIPRRSVTRFAPVRLPDELAASPQFTDLSRLYTEQVFGQVGHPFDLRVCVKNFPPTHLLAQDAVFEDLDFTSTIDIDYKAQITFEIDKDSRLDGFLLWLNLYPAENEVLDSLRTRLSWLPVFFPVFYPGLDVAHGDIVSTTISRRLGSHERMPDYRLSGSVLRRAGAAVTFEHESAYRTRTFGGSAFYRVLFANGRGTGQVPPPVEAPLLSGPHRPTTMPAQPSAGQADRGLVPELRRFLRGQVPNYAIPSEFVILDELPATTSGKVDRKRLPLPQRDVRQADAAYVPPRTELEQSIAAIWAEVLEIGQVGVNENFFDLGGNSLLITQVRSRIQRLLNREISVIDLFRYPTVSAFARFAECEQAESDAFQAVRSLARQEFEAVGQLHGGAV